MNSAYFDNSATSYPKPQAVLDNSYEFFTHFGGNPGRSGHFISLNTANKVYLVREKIAKYFNCQAKDVVFTQNCTHALNLAIKGLIRKNDHVITTNYEHNSVLRPIFDLFSKDMITYDIINVHECTTDEILNNIVNKIKFKTKILVVTLASNVTGKILPIKEISKICKERNIKLIVDASQYAGILPIDVKLMGIDVLCTSGHKSLYGIGIGLLINNLDTSFNTIIQGGTGTNSLEFTMPVDSPEQLEAGTLNVFGIISLGAGVDFINQVNGEEDNFIYNHDKSLCDEFLEFCEYSKKVTVYRYSTDTYIPIVSFNVNNIDCEKVGEYLSNNGFCLRAGYMCASLIHTKLKTIGNGVLRFSPSVFNTKEEVRELCRCIEELV